MLMRDNLKVEPPSRTGCQIPDIFSNFPSIGRFQQIKDLISRNICLRQHNWFMHHNKLVGLTQRGCEICDNNKHNSTVLGLIFYLPSNARIKESEKQ